MARHASDVHVSWLFRSSPAIQSRFASFKHERGGLCHAFWDMMLRACVCSGLRMSPEGSTPATPQRASPIWPQSRRCQRRAPVHRRSRRHQLQWQLPSRTKATKATSGLLMAGLLAGSPSGLQQPLGASVPSATATRKVAGAHGLRKELHLWTASSSGCRAGLRGRGASCISKPARPDALSL